MFPAERDCSAVEPIILNVARCYFGDGDVRLSSMRLKLHVFRSLQPSAVTRLHCMTIMPPSQPAFRWRTLLELTAISAALYFFLGAPGLSGVLKSDGKHVTTPKALVRPESLVYPHPYLECAEFGYDVHVYSTKPLVIYIDGFLSGKEAEQLVELR